MKIEDVKSGEAALSSQTKKTYQTPRLLEYGQVYSIVAAGTGPVMEGALMLLMMLQRP